MVKYSLYLWGFHLWQGLFATFDVYLPYLSDRSYFMVPYGPSSPSTQVIQALKRIALDPIKITST